MNRIILLLLTLSNCYVEWDYPVKIPRRDPCTKRVENKYIYVNPTCPHPIIHPVWNNASQ